MKNCTPLRTSVLLLAILASLIMPLLPRQPAFAVSSYTWTRGSVQFGHFKQRWIPLLTRIMWSLASTSIQEWV
jgi:hypothetical protein